MGSYRHRFSEQMGRDTILWQRFRLRCGIPSHARRACELSRPAAAAWIAGRFLRHAQQRTGRGLDGAAAGERGGWLADNASFFTRADSCSSGEQKRGICVLESFATLRSTSRFAARHNLMRTRFRAGPGRGNLLLFRSGAGAGEFGLAAIRSVPMNHSALGGLVDSGDQRGCIRFMRSLAGDAAVKTAHASENATVAQTSDLRLPGAFRSGFCIGHKKRARRGASRL